MAYNEGAYQNLLFGVSQQAPQDRLVGQLEEQINMTSDLVGGLRRRASVEAVGIIGSYTDIKKIRQYNTDLAGTAVSLVVDTATGSLKVVREGTSEVLATLSHTYLQAASAASIRMVTLEDAVWICNVDVKPTLTAHADKSTYPDPNTRGYFYIAAGAYSKEYRVTLTNRVNGNSTDISFTTPSGASSGDAANAQPEYIAQQLANAAASAWSSYGVTVNREGAYVTIRCTNAQPTISSTSGSGYVRTSGAMAIRDAAELPARLHSSANNVIVGIGLGEAKTYYRYDDAKKLWTEDAAWEALEGITNMPLRLSFDGTNYVLEAPEYERRAAGSAKNNPALKCVSDGITGMAVFQGRLVLLSNEYCCMSASGKPMRWFRSTVTSLTDDDCIEVAAQGSLTAPYEYGVNFNKDLVLFSRRYQGVVAGSGLVTPRTANVALMTRYEVDTEAEPVATGRSVFFGAPRSMGYSGIHEMLPSQYTDSQYVADDVTAHIPRYIKGPWRFMAASSTSNILVAGCGEANTMIVHEYLWSAAEKAHHAWHKWRFAWPVIDAYFSGDVLICLFGVNGQLLAARIDLQRGAGDLSPTVPRLDFYREVTCTQADRLTVPEWLCTLGTDLRAFKVQGENTYMGQAVTPIGAPSGGNQVLDVIAAKPGEVYAVGFPFESYLIPTSPVIKDAKDVPITTSRAVLHRYRVSVANTGKFYYKVYDRARPVAERMDTTPLRLFSQKLGAGMPLADSAVVTLPARVDMWTAMLELSTTDYYDLCIRSIEYGFRFHQRFRRA